MPVASAMPRAAARPTRSPVKLPGPVVTAMRCERLAETLVADYGLFHLEADLRWIDLTAARLDQLAREIRR